MGDKVKTIYSLDEFEIKHNEIIQNTVEVTVEVSGEVTIKKSSASIKKWIGFEKVGKGTFKKIRD